MRTTLTFVLRLLVDTDDPQVLRGMIRTVGCTEEHAFADEQALLALRQMMERMTDADRPERHDDSGTASTAQKDRHTLANIAIQPSDGQVLIGGWFTTTSGSPHNRLAWLSANGSGTARSTPTSMGVCWQSPCSRITRFSSAVPSR